MRSNVANFSLDGTLEKTYSLLTLETAALLYLHPQPHRGLHCRDINAHHIFSWRTRSQQALLKSTASRILTLLAGINAADRDR